MKIFSITIVILISYSLFSQGKVEINFGEASGDNYLANKEYSKALIEYDKAIKQNENEPYNYYLRGLCNYYTDRYLEAITDLTKSLNMTNELEYSKNWKHGPRSKNVNGKVKEMVGGGSFEHYYYHVFFYRAFSKMNLDDYYGAIADFNEYLKYDSKNSEIYEFLGKCYTILEKYEKGIKSLSIAIELNKNNAEAYLFRARCYDFINQREKSCLDLSKAGELGKTEAYDIIRKICQ